MGKDYEEGMGCAMWSACEEPFREGERENALEEIKPLIENAKIWLENVTSVDNFRIGVFLGNG